MNSLVDFHTHYSSRAFFETLARSSPLPGPASARLQRVAAAAGLELPPEDDDLHLARWIAELDHNGVQHAVTFASVAEEADVVAAAVGRSYGRLSGFAVLDPRAPDAVARAEGLLGEQGFRGLVLFPALHGYRLDGPELERVAAAAEPWRPILVAHCGLLSIPLRDRFGLPRRIDPRLGDPLAIVPLADRHPDLRFVVPHFGAGFLRETLMLGVACPNAHVDTSSSNGWIATQPGRLELADVFERVLEVFGPRRILFGTDSSVFPRGWRHDILLAQREALGACGLGEEDLHRIFHRNAAELLELEPAAIF